MLTGIMKRIILSIAIFLGFTSSFLCAQTIAVKTNVFYGAYTYTPNIGVEIGIRDRFSIDVSGGYNPWNRKGSRENNKKLVHLLIQPEFRYWLDGDIFRGHLIGGHALFSHYNISGHKLPLLFGKDSAGYRYEGYAAGIGLSYGYQFVLAEKWRLEAAVGVGYARLIYDKYDCIYCGKEVSAERMTKNYFGPTRAAISIVFLIK